MQKSSAVFLDFNGTLNNKGGYCHARELEASPWAVQAIKLVNEHGLPVAVITNQSGVADHKFSLGELNDCFLKMIDTLEKQGAYIEAIYSCPHAKEDGCGYKKPSPAMLTEAARFLNVEIKNCFMIGDTGYSDMGAGHAAGCKLILVRTGNGVGSLEIPEYRESWKPITPDFIAKDVLGAARWVCSSVPKQSWKHEHTKILSL
jgi:histidinol-phosphate phosphatase family protein